MSGQCTCGQYRAAEAEHRKGRWCCAHCGGESIQVVFFASRTIYGRGPKGWDWLRRPEWINPAHFDYSNL
jgi:hypothetical protein